MLSIKNKCFQYVVNVPLNHEQMGKHPEIIAKIKTITNKYNWEKINFPSERDDWKKIEKNNVTIALNVLYVNKRKKYTLCMFQNITQIGKIKLFFE